MGAGRLASCSLGTQIEVLTLMVGAVSWLQQEDGEPLGVGDVCVLPESQAFVLTEETHTSGDAMDSPEVAWSTLPHLDAAQTHIREEE